MPNNKEKTLKSNIVFDGKVIKLHYDEVLCPNGKKSTREFVTHNGGVCILAFINNRIIMVKQFRYAYQEELLEIPAGKLEKGEDPYAAGIRELEEETGYKAESLTSLGSIYPTCGYSNEIIYIYLANNLTKTHMHLDEDEMVEPITYSLEEITKMIDNNIIKDAKTICAIQKYLLRKKD